MHDIQQHLLQVLDNYPVKGKYVIAFSGGCDSVVLLHAAANMIKRDKLLAVHINHGLQNQAESWNQFCKNFAQQLSIPYKALYAELDGRSSNLEAQARQARYHLLASQLGNTDYLLTAHHQDDQAETLLLQLMRGSGLEGLSAMSEQSVVNGIGLLRPLLNISKQQLLAYAHEHQLEWIDDPTNLDTSFNRNYIRHEIMPLLASRWPAVVNNIARSASNCREAAELVGLQAKSDLSGCLGSHPHMLSIKKLSLLSTARRHHVVRLWIADNDFPLPDREKIETICSSYLNTRKDAKPVIEWQDAALYRFNNFLFLLKPFMAVDIKEIHFTASDIQSGMIELPEPIGKLYFRSPLNEARAAVGQLSIRFRQDGETVQLAKRAGHRKLKKLFQEWKIPPWMRNYVPLIFNNEQCVAIADYAICESADASAIEVLSWQPSAGYEW